MNEIFADDLFMAFRRDGGEDATGFDLSAFDRELFGQERNHLLLGYAGSVVGHHENLPNSVQCRSKAAITCPSIWRAIGRKKAVWSESHREVTRKRGNEPHPDRWLVHKKRAGG
jgi:hypothetical protein